MDKLCCEILCFDFFSIFFHFHTIKIWRRIQWNNACIKLLFEKIRCLLANESCGPLAVLEPGIKSLHSIYVVLVFTTGHCVTVQSYNKLPWGYLQIPTARPISIAVMSLHIEHLATGPHLWLCVVFCGHMITFYNSFAENAFQWVCHFLTTATKMVIKTDWSHGWLNLYPSQVTPVMDRLHCGHKT